MSREIKFRGRISQCLEGAGNWVGWGINGTDMIDAIDPETIGQYTGLKDKEGVEIYEGDIIWRHDCVNGGGCMGYDQVYFNERALSWGFIAWNGSFTPFHRWRVDGSTDGGGVVSSDVFELNKCKVIGNVHENGDLLSSKNRIYQNPELLEDV